MSNKNKTISFRVNEDTFEVAREIADERDISLSEVFRDYVDMLVAHDGRVRVVPEHQVSGSDGSDDSFPPMVKVPTSFVREHERLELEAEHLRDQLDEHKRYVTALRTQLEELEDEEIIHLDDLEDENEHRSERYQLG